MYLTLIKKSVEFAKAIRISLDSRYTLHMCSTYVKILIITSGLFFKLTLLNLFSFSSDKQKNQKEVRVTAMYDWAYVRFLTRKVKISI